MKSGQVYCRGQVIPHPIARLEQLDGEKMRENIAIDGYAVKLSLEGGCSRTVTCNQ